MAFSMDWSGLLPELIELIFNRLTHHSDHHNFVSVCSSWRSVTINRRYHRCHLPCRLPLLMLPDNDNTETRNFFNISSGKCYGFHLPEIHRKWCCGSSQGWLVTVDGSTREIQLFNPFSGCHIQLPSLSTFTYPQFRKEPEYPHDSQYIYKAVLSSNPCKTSDYVVVAIVTCEWRLAYYKPGADKWTTMETSWICFEDVIYYNGLFYAISNNGPVLTYDFSSDPPIETLIMDRPQEGRLADMYYLVESSGELLFVLRHFTWDEGPRFKTFRFKVRKLDESKRKWIEMKSIGDCILFLGYGCSMSIPVQNFPGCKGNSIYFNDDYDYGPSGKISGYNDIGVFNFDNGSVESFYENPPIWTTPSFWITPTTF